MKIQTTYLRVGMYNFNYVIDILGNTTSNMLTVGSTQYFMHILQHLFSFYGIATTLHFDVKNDIIHYFILWT